MAAARFWSLNLVVGVAILMLKCVSSYPNVSRCPAAFIIIVSVQVHTGSDEFHWKVAKAAKASRILFDPGVLALQQHHLVCSTSLRRVSG